MGCLFSHVALPLVSSHVLNIHRFVSPHHPRLVALQVSTMPRSASREPEPLSNLSLPYDAEELDPDKDYFLKQTEFRIWLREEKGKVCDTYSSILTLHSLYTFSHSTLTSFLGTNPDHIFANLQK